MRCNLRVATPFNASEFNVREGPALVDELPLEQRTVLEMTYSGGITHSEVADRTDFPLGTIKTNIQSALKKLRSDLQPRRRGSEMQSRKV